MSFRLIRSYEETVKDIEKTFGMLPGFFKNTPKDVLPQMWPLFKKYQIGDSLIPKKYREMMMLASAAATKCPYCQTYHREVAKMLGATDQELGELAVVVVHLEKVIFLRPIISLDWLSALSLVYKIH